MKRYYSPLNALDIQYASTNGAGGKKGIGVVRSASDGVLSVDFFCTTGSVEKIEIESLAGSKWNDRTNGVEVSVKTNPPGRDSRAALTYAGIDPAQRKAAGAGQS